MSIILDGTKGTTTPGLYTNATFTDTFSDGVVIDYTTGLGRVSVGTADGLAFYNGGIATTELMRISSTGNVGIGTSSPNQRLTVSSTGTYSAAMWNETAVAAGVGSSILIAGGTAGNGLAAIGGYFSGAATTDGGYLTLSTRAVTSGTITERMRIDSAGNLGLGVTPSAWYSSNNNKAMQIGSYLSLLSDNQNGYASLANNVYQSTTNSSSGWNYVTTNPATKYTQNLGSHAWYYAASGTAGNAVTWTQAMTLTSGGNLGIGTSSPISLLSIDTKATSNGITVGDFFNNSAPGTAPNIQSLGSRNDGNASFGGRFGAAYRRLDGTAIASATSLGYYAFGGQWGTDTTYQSAKLLYTASIVGVAEGNFTSATAMPTAIVFRTGSTGEAITSVNTTYGTERMRIDSSGNVGIGTSSPNSFSKLDVRGRIRCGSGASSGDSEISWNNYASTTSAWQVSVRQDVGGANNDLKFLRFDSSGTYQGIAMQVTSASGNLQFSTTDAGIIFSKSGALTNSTLNDYETGTWTPVLVGSGSSPTVSYSTRTGVYTKIGNLVYVSIRMDISSISGGSGNLTIGSLPFANNGNAYPAANIAYKSGWTTNGPDYGRIVGGNIELYKSNNTGETVITVANLNSATAFIISGCYQTA